MVRSFLGLCTYYRRFVQDFASVAAPLHRLTRIGAHFQWDEARQAAFDGLKKAMGEAPVLPKAPLPVGHRHQRGGRRGRPVTGEGREGARRGLLQRQFQLARTKLLCNKEGTVDGLKSLEHFHQ